MGSEAKRIAMDVLGWMWGTVQGAFNEKMDISQIIVDAVIGMIPLVGDVTAVRDLIAISLGLAEDEKKREDTMQWVMLVIFVFALIPIAGGVIKGVGRLALKVTEDLAKNAKVLEEVITFLNRVGHGNAVKYLKELNVMKYQAEILEKFHGFIDTVNLALSRVKEKLGGILSADMLATIDRWRMQLGQLRKLADAKIPLALKELNAKLLKLQQLVYRGEWSTVTAGTKNVTREAEARLVEESQIAATRSAHGGAKQNPATSLKENEIAKVYQPKDGWIDLRSRSDPIQVGKSKAERYPWIEAFSGPIKAAELKSGDTLVRIFVTGDKANGAWWIRVAQRPKSGKEWRELFAVLDEFSKNGSYAIARVKEGHSLKVWEGKVSEQFGKTNPGQYLTGGGNQLFMNSRDPATLAAFDIIETGLTKWTDLSHVGYAAGNIKVASAARVERLAEHEEQPKRAAGAH
jgi:hypothetical protein